MKQNRFRHLVALILLMCCTLGYAQKFEIDGLEYEVIDESKRYVEVDDGADIYTKIVKIPSTVTRGGIIYTVNSIGDFAFVFCYSLTSITIPSSVKSIGEAAFARCESLTSINIPSSVKSIGEKAFAFCSSLTSINIPSSVKSIGNMAFWECSSLTSINIPSSVTSIGEYAFEGCSSLTSINIPSSVTSIGYGAFYNCSSLTTITLPEHITNIDELDIPEGVRIIMKDKTDHSIGNIASYKKKEKKEEEEVLDNAVVEVGATYPGGYAAILSHIAKNIKYPEIAIKHKIQGVVTLRFKIEKDGSISSVTVVGSLSPECDREAVRVVKTLGRFTPAKQQGKIVAVWYTLPVRFQIPKKGFRRFGKKSFGQTSLIDF